MRDIVVGEQKLFNFGAVEDVEEAFRLGDQKLVLAARSDNLE